MSDIDLSPAQRVISRILEGEKGAHAVMLIGAEGTEKKPLARKLVRGWLGVDDEFDLGRAVDLLRVDPSGPSRQIKLPQIIFRKTVDAETVNISDFLRTMPLKYKKKVVWMDCPERMNKDAANGLLKMLEEPPPYARFLMTTSSPSGILATILSRCSLVACKPVDDATMANVSPMVKLFAEGDPDRMATILAKEDAFNALFDFFQNLPRRPYGESLKASEEFRQLVEGLKLENGRENQSEGIRLLGLWLQSTGAHPKIRLDLTELHRRIVGNGGAGYQIDPFFCQLLSK